MKKLLHLILVLPLFANSQICNPPTALSELNIGNVQATILNGGDFYFDGQNSMYEVPKADPIAGSAGVRSIFGGGIWLSALNSSNELKVAAMTYRNQEFEFYPGPINNITGEIDFANCNYFDQIFEVFDSDIETHLNQLNNTYPIPTNQVNPRILNWPAKGNSHISAVTISDDLAPFVDLNNNDIYEPEFGDYPKINGDQALFWVMNDIGGPHEKFNGDPLKVQVQMLAYAYDSGLLLNTTIYQCKVINKSFGHLHDFRFGLFLDPDIPPTSNNYVGCDTSRSASFCYPSGTYNINPVNSVTFLDQEMNSFNFIINGGPTILQDPTNAIEVNHLLHARYLNGDPFSTPSFAGPMPITHMVHGNPDNPNEWSMNHTPQLTPSDYRTLQTSGPHNIDAWTSFNITWAIHTSFPQNYSPFDFYEEVGEEIDSIKALFSNFDYTYDYSSVTALSESLLNEGALSIFPNPAVNQIRIQSSEIEIESIQILGLDGKLLRAINQNEFEQAISIDNLANGIYILAIQTDKGIAAKKFVKH